MKKLLFLDDYRDPFDTKIDWMVFSPIGRNVEIIWVKSYDEFIRWIEENGLPNGICFDHDLSDFQAFYANYPELMKDIPFPEYEKTGMDCVKWLVEYCMDNNLKLPLYNIQSANTVGKENMKCYLENFKKHS